MKLFCAVEGTLPTAMEREEFALEVRRGKGSSPRMSMKLYFKHESTESYCTLNLNQ